jgi:hypothetical protein
MTGRHRNNAAEWVIWGLLLPAFPLMWTLERILGRYRSAATGSTAKESQP